MLNDAPGSIFGPGLVFHDRYRLDEAVATGGMAQVWRGRDLILQRPVAIKLLHPHLATDEKTNERFHREAIAAARLTHPNIVPTFDTGSDHGATYIVLGLVDGPTLGSALEKQTFSAWTTCMLGAQVAGALDHAHRQGLVHRDIKPSNVMLVDNNERVMVADFGISRVITETIDPSLTLPGFVMGTPEYIAPELMKGAEAGPSVDIYALGVLLHQMFCGHTIADVPTQDVAHTTSSAATPCPHLPQALAEIVYTATQQNPQDRYSTASEMQDALRTAEAHFQKHESPKLAQHIEPSPDAHPTQAIPRTSVPQRRVVAQKPNPLKEITVTRRAQRRLKTISLVAVLFAVVLAASLGRFLASLSDEDKTAKTSSNTPISVTNAISFDPLGSDKAENEAQTKNLIDGDPGTSWATETYSNRSFGNLKQGVGIVVSLSSSTPLDDIKVTSPSSGWSASIYVTDQSSKALTGWGLPTTSLANVNAGTTTFRLEGSKGSQILLWITDLGNANKVQIENISIDAHA